MCKAKDKPSVFFKAAQHLNTRSWRLTASQHRHTIVGTMSCQSYPAPHNPIAVHAGTTGQTVWDLQHLQHLHSLQYLQHLQS
jgi:hypothetical protein